MKNIRRSCLTRRIASILLITAMLIGMAPISGFGEGAGFAYADTNKLELDGTPTVYVQSGGQTIFSIQVKNISGADLKGVNFYQGHRSIDQLNENGFVDGCSTHTTITYPDADETDEWFRFSPYFEKDKSASNATWDSDEDGYTIGAGETAKIWLRVNSYYENPGTYHEWIILGNTHQEYVGGFYPVTIVDEAYTGHLNIDVVTYNPSKAAITLGTSTTHGRTINTVALGSTINFGTIDISKSSNLNQEKTIFTRNTSDYNGTDDHGNSSDIKVDLSVDTTNANWNIGSPFSCVSYLMNGASWSPLPAASMEANSWQQAQTGISLSPSYFVEGTYTAQFKLTTTPHGVKVNGGSVNNKGVYTWPVSVTLTGTNPRIPKAPKNVRATAGNGQVELTWDAADGAEDGQDYTVWRREGAETNAAAKDTASFDWNKYEYVGNTVPKANGDYLFVDGTVTNGKSYTYAVIGGELLKSYPALSSKVTPQSTIASKLQAPEDLSVMFTDEGGGIRFSWEMNENYGGDQNDGSSMVDHFNVYRDNVLVMQVDQKAVQAKPYYYDELEPMREDPNSEHLVEKVKFSYEWETVVDAPVANQYYTLNVAAVSKSGVEGYWSEDASYYSVPAELEIANYSANVSSYWDDNDHEVIYASLGIEVGENSGAPEKVEFWRSVGTSAPDTSKTPYHVNRGDSWSVRSFTDEPLQAGKTYTYTARATDRDGNVSNDVTFTVKVPSGTDVYSANYSPENVTWKVIDGKKAQMQFYADQEYEEGGSWHYAGTYKVNRNNVLKKTYNPSGTTNGTITYEDDPGSDGTYTYRVDRIVNGITVRGKDYVFTRNTKPVNTDSLLKAPSAPLFNVRISEGRPVLQWAPSNADEEIDGYYIYRKDAGEYINGHYYDDYYGIKYWNNKRYIVVDKSVTGLTDESGNFMGDSEKGYLEGVSWTEEDCPHEYWITAYNRVGESAPSQVFTFDYLGRDPETGEVIIPTNNDDYKPGTPTINNVWVDWEDDSQDNSQGIWDEAIGGNIHLSWTDAANSVGSIDEWEVKFTGTHYDSDTETVYAYQVMQYPGIKDGTDGYAPKSYVDADVSTEYSGDYGRTATVKVTAKNSAGSSTSKGKSITVRSLPRFRVKPDDGAVQLEWTDLFKDETTVVNKWEMWRKGEIGSWEKLATLNASGLSYAAETDSNGVQNYMWRDETAENGWTYQYKVVAECADGYDRESVVRTAKPSYSASAVAPGKVQNLKATKNNNGEIIFTWDAPATGKAQHYQLIFEQKYDNGDKQWIASTEVDAPANTIVWSYDQPGTYRFAVWAYSHINGRDAPEKGSVWETEDLYELYPSASDIVEVTLTESDINAQAQSYPGVTKLIAIGGENKIELSWTAASGATYYRIERQNMDEDEDIVEMIITGNNLTYTDTNVVPGIEYRYIINPYNSYGTSAYDDAYARATGRTKDQVFADAVATIINALPNVEEITALNYTSYEDYVNQAHTEYKELTQKQRNMIAKETVDKLLAVMGRIESLEHYEEDKQIIEDVIAEINALPEALTIDKSNVEEKAVSVEDARESFNSLEERQKALMESENAGALETLAGLEAKIAELRAEIAEDIAKAEQATNAINALAEDIALSDEAAVEAARNAYDELSDDQKAYVSAEVLSKLEAAEERIVDLTAAKVVADMINSLDPDVPLDSEAAVEAARAAYNSLTEAQKALVKPSVLERLAVCEETLETRKEAAEKIEKIEEDIRDKEQERDNATNDLEDLRDERDQLQQAINDLENDIDDLTGEKNELIAEKGTLAEEKAALESERDELLSKVDNPGLTNEEAARLDAINTRLGEITARETEIDERIPAIENLISEKEQQITEKQGELEGKDQAIKDKEDELEDINNALDGLQDELNEQKGNTEVVVVKNRIKMLPDPNEITLDDEQNIQDAIDAYEALTDEQKAQVPQEVVEKLKEAERKLNALKPKDIAKASITLSNVTYNGAAQKPAVKIVLDGETLTKDVDYSLAYANNTNVGTARVTITGKGKYVGTVNKSFKINQRAITPTVVLNATNFNFTNKVITPKVTVKDGAKVLPATQYTITWPAGRKNIGTYTVKVTLKGNYKGTKSVKFTIGPKAASISKPKAGKKAITVKWKAQTAKMPKKQITGYEVQYSTRKDFKSGVKTKTLKGAKKSSVKISKLKSKTTYYVRVRTYMKVGGKTYYSTWSAVKSVRAK